MPLFATWLVLSLFLSMYFSLCRRRLGRSVSFASLHFLPGLRFQTPFVFLSFAVFPSRKSYIRFFSFSKRILLPVFSFLKRGKRRGERAPERERQRERAPESARERERERERGEEGREERKERRGDVIVLSYSFFVFGWRRC